MNRTLAQLYEEASVRHEGWGLRLLSWADIVTWADTWVLALAEIPDDLLAVSLSRQPTREAQDGLAHLIWPVTARVPKFSAF
ncbi:hypothetical protein [Deinococcus ficus]|uniref:hypothetical protein n=1 Tax=Deinococcus ficus TaxID=317577 RepID=UPI00174AF504|nr:hypothetical protein [Deinococcus ficus]GHF77240.1 hypothetical protein GCM10017782_14180 [Deinococcus ficus]